MEKSGISLSSDDDLSDHEENDDKSTENSKNNFEFDCDASKSHLQKKPMNSFEIENQESIKRIKFGNNSSVRENISGSSEIQTRINQIVALFKKKKKKPTNIVNLSEDVLEIIFEYLSNDDKLNIILSSKILMQIVGGSYTILRSFVLIVAIYTISRISETPELSFITFRNVELNFEKFNDQNDVLIVFKKFKQSIEILKIKNANFKSYREISKFITELPSLRSITFENCHIGNHQIELVPTISSLQTLNITNCNENIFKVCQLQKNLQKIIIKSDKIELPNEIFDTIAKICNNLEHLVLIGKGTRNFFNFQNNQFKLKRFETTMLTYDWYERIKTERISFLKSQIGHLKGLTIHQLPNDFDGGRVLKFIFNNMNLETFNYGKIPLILNGQKQEVKEIEATEIQICSAFEMIRQFPSIKSIRLTLSSREISTLEVEKIVNPKTNLFDRIEEFEVVDNSEPRCIFGVFLGLYKNLKNLKKLTLKTQDRNINVLLEEFLPFMKNLTEIYINSTERKYVERFNLIKTFVPHLKKLSIPQEFVKIARQIFDRNVEIYEIN